MLSAFDYSIDFEALKSCVESLTGPCVLYSSLNMHTHQEEVRPGGLVTLRVSRAFSSSTKFNQSDHAKWSHHAGYQVISMFT